MLYGIEGFESIGCSQLELDGCQCECHCRSLDWLERERMTSRNVTKQCTKKDSCDSTGEDEEGAERRGAER